MANKLGVTIVLSILGASSGLAACGDDPAGAVASDAGAGGGTPVAAAGTKSGGTSSGGSGSNAGNGGADSGGVPATAGASGDGGAATSVGGAPGGAGAGGADGGAPGLTYVCGDNDLSHKLCSALKANGCSDETVCSDCVELRDLDRGDYLECDTCLAEFDKSYQCAIDAFESGTPLNGIECVDGFGADLNETCFGYLFAASECHNYVTGGSTPNPCPATWPLL